MVGTRSKVPASAAYDYHPSPSADSEEGSQDANVDATPSSPPPQPRVTSTLEGLPRSVRGGGGGLITYASRPRTTTTQGKGGLSSLAPAPVVTLRSSSRSTAGGAVSHAAGRASTRTSLERLPLPPPPAAGSPARGGRRSVGGASATTPPRRSSRASGGPVASATSKANSELNALLGLDAAVRQRTT